MDQTGRLARVLEGPPAMASRNASAPTRAGTRSPWFSITVVALLACAAVPFMAVWRDALLGPYDPRVACIAREQFVKGDYFGVPTFSGMVFLEKPPLIYSLIALGFSLTGEARVIAARMVNGLLLLAWLVAAYGTTRLVAGTRAALLATCFLASSNLFLALADRLSIDGGLAACLALTTWLLCRALSYPGERLPTGPWLMALAAGGLCFLAKGLFGTFLFLGPLLAYAFWARDRRVLRELVRPVAIFVLLAPAVYWAWMLYSAGGLTYLAEAFLNNSLGRFIHVRFELADIASLPYGDVNGPREWSFYITRLGSLAGPALLLLPFALMRFRRASAGPRERLAALCVCQAFVPILVLSFSSQKGVHHLGSVSSAFAILAALWLDERLSRTEIPDPFTCAVVLGMAALAPLALVASLVGWLDTSSGLVFAGSLVAFVSLGGIVFLALRRSWMALTVGALTSLMAFVIVAGARGGFEPETLQLLETPRIVQAGLGGTPLGVYGAGESALGAFSWVTRSEVAWIRDRESLEAFLAVEEPHVVAVRQRGLGDVSSELLSGATLGRVGKGPQTYTLLGNPAARSRVTPEVWMTDEPGS